MLWVQIFVKFLWVPGTLIQCSTPIDKIPIGGQGASVIFVVASGHVGSSYFLIIMKCRPVQIVSSS